MVALTGTKGESPMRLIAAAIIGTGLGGAALAECALPEPSAPASGWQVIEGEDFAFTAENPAFPGLTVDLTMDAPVIPEVLDFVQLDRYGGRVALLQYFSGDPGTSALVTMVRNAVIDLGTGQTLATPLYSADCQPIAWTWFPDYIEIADAALVERIRLPAID